MATDLTIEVLREIRDGIRELREDFNARLDQTNQRLERVEHGLNDLGGFMRRIALDQAKHERFHRHHVERLEGDVADLKERVHRLEERAGP
jgi:predicted nuclease with TOPRIM domain